MSCGARRDLALESAQFPEEHTQERSEKWCTVVYKPWFIEAAPGGESPSNLKFQSKTTNLSIQRNFNIDIAICLQNTFKLGYLTLLEA
jgi:hypothetical protein